MPEHSYTSRRELDQYRFRPAVTLLAPLALLVLQALLPKLWPPLAILDLPLIAVIFFAVARRSPTAGAVTGTLIGLFQDGLTNHPLGIYGISKAIVGYIAASIGFTVDVENVLNRALLNFGFSLMQSGLLYVIQRLMLADRGVHMLWLHELIRAVLNTVAAVPIFFLLDRFKRRE